MFIWWENPQEFKQQLAELNCSQPVAKGICCTCVTEGHLFGSLVCPTQMWTLWVGRWSCPLNRLQLCRYITEAPASAGIQRQGHIQLWRFLCRPQILEAGLPSLPASHSTNPPAHLPGSHYPVTPTANTMRFTLKTLQLIIACNYEKLRENTWNAYQRGGWINVAYSYYCDVNSIIISCYSSVLWYEPL